MEQNINKENINDETSLFNAWCSGNEYLVEYLVEHGVDINKENTYLETPLFNACNSGNKELTKY